MKTLMRRVLLVLLLAAPLAANAEVLSIRLEQPAKGATLTGGSTATIAWSATSLDSEVEEWEAFLSVDGGRYYGARITPHLDASIREFRWTVPNVSSRDARILLRFGNEKNEHVVELPVSLEIEAAAPTRVSTAACRRRRRHDGRRARAARRPRRGGVGGKRSPRHSPDPGHLVDPCTRRRRALRRRRTLDCRVAGHLRAGTSSRRRNRDRAAKIAGAKRCNPAFL